jgi:hypothetical protein
MGQYRPSVTKIQQKSFNLLLYFPSYKLNNKYDMPTATKRHAKRAAHYWRARRIAASLKVYSQDYQYYQALYDALQKHAR